MHAIDGSGVSRVYPHTEAGHLYVRLMQRINMDRRVGHSECESEIVDQLQMLWERMDTAEQGRVEQSVPRPSDLLF